MGYVTRYELKAKYHEAATPEAAILKLTQDNAEAGYVLAADGNSNESGKWYEHEADLLALSRQYPHLLFVLNGWGEEPGDIWVKYFLNGRVQKETANLTLAAFDPDKLK